MSDKELIWVSADFAKRYNAVESDAEKIKQFEEYLAGVSAQSKSDHMANLEAMEEEVAIYRGAMLKAKQSWAAAKDEALAASYALWEQFDKERPNVNKKIATMISDLQPLLDKTSQLNSALSNLPVYQLEKVVDLLERMQRLDDRTRTMFESVVKASGE
jgi:hypothetical protein